MKKYLLFIGFSFLACSLFSQNAVAVDDTVYVKMGETITFNPLLNDYDPEGDEFGVQIVESPNVEIISFTDSTITFKVPSYFTPNTNLKINYYLDLANSYPENKGEINILLDISIVDTLQINQISAAIFPDNIQFYDHYFGTNSSQYNYPKESMTRAIFQSSLWIGGNDDDGLLHFSGDVSGYNGGDFWTGPLDAYGEPDSENIGDWFRTWKVSKEEISYHINHYNDVGYVMPEAIGNWPANGNPELNQSEYIAPFVDVDLDGIYHPENGDYPLIKGDVSIFFIYNDQKNHYDSQGIPLGIEIHCMAWAYEGEGITDPLNNTIFYSYKFFNKSNTTYYDTYVGIYADLDLGNPWDDYVGCHVKNGNFFAYNGDDFDEDQGDENYPIWGYSENIPVQGVCILGGPHMDEDNLDNLIGQCDESINGVGFGDGITDNERHGMSRFVSYINNGFPFPPPFNAAERYELMQGYFPNGYVLGGGDEPWRFMYPGYSDSCNWGGIDINLDTVWTEETSGNQPNDRKGLASTGPFTFQAGSVHYLDIALVTAPGDQETPSKDLLQEYIAQIKQDYLLNPEEFGNQYLSIPEETKVTQQLLVYPNPADGDIIRFELNNQQGAEYFIYNATGQMIENGSLAAQKEHSLNIGHLKAGWYILEVKTGGLVLRSKLIL